MRYRRLAVVAVVVAAAAPRVLEAVESRRVRRLIARSDVELAEIQAGLTIVEAEQVVIDELARVLDELEH
jgi:hypothetical protein